jgi:hypothetical protein
MSVIFSFGRPVSAGGSSLNEVLVCSKAPRSASAIATPSKIYLAVLIRVNYMLQYLITHPKIGSEILLST